MLRLASRHLRYHRPSCSPLWEAPHHTFAAKNKCGKNDHVPFISSQFGALSRTDVRGNSCDRRQMNDVPILKQHARSFLGCIGGGEDSELSKHFEEVRLIGYSPDQLFAVVAAVDLYEDFLPWCQRSTVLQRNDGESFQAELEIGFKFFMERYISHVQLKRPNLIKTSVSQSNLFHYLNNTWEFQPGPVPGSCNLNVAVNFQFRSSLYRKASSVFLDEVVVQLVSSFEDRCHRVYGPSTDISKSCYRGFVPNPASA
ncbi:hypothetical protein O6H91_07G098800 [Diphasiastrum complanatum]|uniref:Uncharacterized protein n=1 Tax=Diphasiastrum complanatum TaxID=34168 RepID=A0ACC2D7Z9_DIPCM|nr:hypothetical protein O6H91_07G098800 [Diphasiastrum complanatum]